MKKNNFKGDVFIYTLGVGVNAIFSFILVTFLSKYLSKSDFGMIESFNTISSLMLVFSIWGGSTYVVNYYTPKGDKKEYNVVVSGMIIQSLFLIMLSFFYKTIFDIEKAVFIYAVIFSIFNSFFTIFRQSLVLEKKVVKYTIITVLWNFAILVGCAALILLDVESFLAKVIPQVVITSLLAFVCFVYFYLNKSIKISFSSTHLRAFYIVGFPLFLTQISSWVIEKIDRLMILDMLSLEALGVYGVGYQFGMTLLMLQIAVTRAWMPFIIENVVDNKRLIVKYGLYVSLLFLLAAFLFSVFAYYYIDIFIDERFHEAKVVAVIIMFGYAIDGIQKIFSNIIVYEKLYKITFYIGVISGVVNVALNYMLIPAYGINGAAFATIGAFLIGLFLNVYVVLVGLKWLKVFKRVNRAF